MVAMPQSVFDILVIGCGGFGSAALAHLAARGLRVAGLDQFQPPHNRGSSHGESRVIRQAYFEHPDYVPLLQRAYTLWDELSERTARLRAPAERELFVRCGLLLAGPAEGPVIAGARESARRHALTLEAPQHSEVAQRFPGLNVPAELDIVFEPDAGFLHAERCVTAHLAEAVRCGATLLQEQRVLQLQCSPSAVTVVTPSGRWSAAAAVVTAGAWTGQLLPDYARHIQVQRKLLFWHPTTQPVWNDLRKSPVHLMELPDPAGVVRQFYGFPSLDGQTVKLAEHTGGEPVADPTSVSRVVDDSAGAGVQWYAEHCLRGVAAAPVRSSVCMYSMSPDGHFLVDRLTDQPVVVAAGFSGHGFKFTSVLGAAVADLIELGQTSLPIGFLSASRLQRD